VSALDDAFERSEALFEIRTDHLVHAAEDAHELGHHGVRASHSPGHLAAVAVGCDHDFGDVLGLERLHELQVDRDAVRRVDVGDRHLAFADLAVTKPVIVLSDLASVAGIGLLHVRIHRRPW